MREIMTSLGASVFTATIVVAQAIAAPMPAAVPGAAAVHATLPGLVR